MGKETIMNIIKDTIVGVACGLRKMDRPPDLFLFLQNSREWTWDEKEICGIPVVHTGIFISQGSTDWDIPLHPLWLVEGDYEMDIHAFQKGYEERV